MCVNVAAIIGFITCFCIMILGIAFNGGIQTVVGFLHLPSMLVTFGGAFLAVLASADSFQDYITGLKSFFEALKKPKLNVKEVYENVIQLSEISRKEGLLALEEVVQDMSDPFLKKGIMLVIDGSEPELVRDIMETAITYSDERTRVKVRFWEDLGAMGPAWGMIGTLIGLINMLKILGTDPSAIGEGMSLALITTLYGSILANWICSPIARKLQKKNNYEIFVKELTIEGVLSIQAGENPRIIQEKLDSFFEEKQKEGKVKEAL